LELGRTPAVTVVLIMLGVIATSWCAVLSSVWGPGFLMTRAGIAEALGYRSLRRVVDRTFWPHRKTCVQPCRQLPDEEIRDFPGQSAEDEPTVTTQFMVVLDDRPGSLARLGGVLGDADVDIEAIQGTSRQERPSSISSQTTQPGRLVPSGALGLRLCSVFLRKTVVDTIEQTIFLGCCLPA
jgi:hypothetical protein